LPANSGRSIYIATWLHNAQQQTEITTSNRLGMASSWNRHGKHGC